MITALAILGAVLGALSMILHVVAPLTKNTVDDKLEEIVDEVKPLVPAPKSPDAK